MASAIPEAIAHRRAYEEFDTHLRQDMPEQVTSPFTNVRVSLFFPPGIENRRSSTTPFFIVLISGCFCFNLRIVINLLLIFGFARYHS